MKRKILLVLVLSVVLLVSVLLINTLRFTSKQIQIEPIQPVSVDESSVARHLAEAIRFQTISYQEAAQTKGEEFLALHKYLEQTFPKVHSTLTKEQVGNYSLLYTWKGRNEKLKPILFLAHQDVVPVEPETLAKWEQPPFEGGIADGYVWGRGAMDDKGSLLGIMEAVEMQLSQGFEPQRTIYLAFGDDEEVGGAGGAAKIAEFLRERNVEFEFVLDEGASITEGIVPDVSKPVAFIGIAEKGYISLELSVEVEGGHSSAPSQETAIGVLSAAINRLEERQMPSRIDGVTSQLLDHIAPEMPFGKRMLMANLWLFKPLVERGYSASPGANATIRTTTAVTIIEAGLKENILPNRARAVVNFRILPGDSIEGVISHVRKAVNDPSVGVNRFGILAVEPSPISNINSTGYETVRRTIGQMFPETIVAPALVLATADSKHFVKLTSNIYRFQPFRARPEDRGRVHGINERISIKDYVGGIQFYYQLISNSAQ